MELIQMTASELSSCTEAMRRAARIMEHLGAEVLRLKAELQDANDDADEYLRQLKLAMHSCMRKRKQLRLDDAMRRSLPVPREVRIMDHAIMDGLEDE